MFWNDTESIDYYVCFILMNGDSGAIHTSLRCLCLRLAAWIGLSESPTCLVCIFCSIIKLLPSSLKMRTLSYRPISAQLFCSTSLSPWATGFASHPCLYNFSASSQSVWSFCPSPAVVQIFSSFFCCQTWTVAATLLDAAPCGSRRYSFVWSKPICFQYSCRNVTGQNPEYQQSSSVLTCVCHDA